MRLSLRYTARFLYASPVWDSHNLLRACPADAGVQRLVRYDVDIEPTTSLFTFYDEWGTRVDAFGIRDPHTELVVRVAAEVETAEPQSPAATVPRTALADDEYRNRVWGFLRATRHTAAGGDIVEAARKTVAGVDDVVAMVENVERMVHDSVEYLPGSTTVGIDVDDVWESRSGVCQDFSHLMVAMLRSVGIGARYVSGYFYAADPTRADHTEEGEVVVATHAWVEAAIPGFGWWALDPTNGAPVGERHVKIGHGRDYDDVSPLRGVYYGESEHELAAEVTMSTRTITTARLPELEAAQVQQ